MAKMKNDKKVNHGKRKMDKLVKRGAIIGGIWGLISGIFYLLGILASGFSGGRDVGSLFENVSFIWKMIYLPAYLTDTIFNLLGDSLKDILFTPLFPLIMISWIIIPIMFGILIGILISAMVKVIKL